MKAKGFTLIELIATVSIISIVSIVGIPGLGHFLHQQSLASTSRLVMHNLALAREYSITNRVYVSVCPTQDQATCSSEWDRDFLIFADLNGDGQQGDGELALWYTEINDTWSVKWKAFGAKPSLTFTPQGFTKHQNGSLSICGSPGGNAMGRMIVLNKAGRSRIGEDKNNNGLSEKSNGKDMAC